MHWLILALSLVRFAVFALDAGYGRAELTSLATHVKAPIVLADGGTGIPGK